MADPFRKDPGEGYTIEFDYTGEAAVAAGATISTAVLSAIELESGKTTTSVYGATSIVGGTVLARVLGGENGLDYKIICEAHLSNTDVLRDSAIMLCRNV